MVMHGWMCHTDSGNAQSQSSNLFLSLISHKIAISNDVEFSDAFCFVLDTSGHLVVRSTFGQAARQDEQVQSLTNILCQSTFSCFGSFLFASLWFLKGF